MDLHLGLTKLPTPFDVGASVRSTETQVVRAECLHARHDFCILTFYGKCEQISDECSEAYKHVLSLHYLDSYSSAILSLLK